MTYDEALVLLEELRGHGRAPFSIQEKKAIEEIYPLITGKKFRRTSCPRCWHDAVIEMAVKLRKPEKIMAKSRYHMRAGFIIHTPAIENGKIYTNANLTDEVAKRYLELFPQKRSMFDIIPEDEPEQPAQESVEAPKDEDEATVQPSEEKPVKARYKRKNKKK